MTPEDDEREGYVPNVNIPAMHCAMGGTDFALRNKSTIIASVKLDELLGALIRG